MTDISEVINDKNYIKVLDKGFVGLVDHMGSDADIAKSARVSYSNGTKTVRQDAGLIRYLVRHEHSSPIEMAEVKFHIKMPMFVARQIIRHRTSSINEVSARYSEMVDDFYIPELENLQPQSKVNNQGRSGSFDIDQAQKYQDMIKQACYDSYQTYKELIRPLDEENGELGLARELSRMVLPVNLYTEFYWKQDLRNLLHLIKLRADSHAQWEIQQYANAMYNLIQPLYPETIRAFDDFKRNTTTITSYEKELLKLVLKEDGVNFDSKVENHIRWHYSSRKMFLEQWNISERELKEFKNTWSDF